MEQNIIETQGEYKILDDWLFDKRCVMLVGGKSMDSMPIADYLDVASSRFGIDIVRFSDFSPNPTYESVIKGVRLFRERKCRAVMAVGGGSAMDVAKCVVLYAGLSGDGENGEWLSKSNIESHIPFLAAPTTAGTGSEATRFAVIYYQGKKQSVTSSFCIPETVLLDSGLLKTLPEYQRKATMLDAFCHAVESFWSVNSTIESRDYSKKSIGLILKNKDDYINNTNEGNAGMLRAANLAGKAISITQTTAGHAMCYKITSMFGCAHGHAAALCVRVLWPEMVKAADSKCCDPRGSDYLRSMFEELATAMEVTDPILGAEKFNRIFEELALDVPKADGEQIIDMVDAINPDRLRNNPIAFSKDEYTEIYNRIFDRNWSIREDK